MPKRILVVEDHEDALESLSTLLAIWGFDVRAASTGREAIDVAASFEPQVAILDLSLPDVDGFDVAEALKTLPQPPFIIALTGYADAALRERVASSGFHYYAVKPWAIEQMRTVLDGAIAHRAARAAK